MRIIFIISIVLFLILNIGTTQQDTTQPISNKEVKPMPKTIKEVKEKYTDSLLALPGVEAVGIGKKNKKDCIMIFVSKLTKESEKKIPKELEGYPVIIHKTGEFKALPKKNKKK